MRDVDEIDLVTPVEKAIGLLSTLDLDFFDVYAAYSRSLSIDILGRGIKEARSRTDLGVGVRAYKNMGLGVAFSQSLEPTDVETTVRRAAGFARAAQPDPYFKGIPGPSKAREVPNLCDGEIVALTLGEAGRLAKRMVDAVESVCPGAMYSGGVGAGHSRSYLMTSTGVSVETEKTSISAFIAPTYRRGEDVGSSHEYDYAISLAEMDFDKIGRRAAEKALEQFGSKRVESGTLPIILTADSTYSLIFGLMRALSGESAVKGRTFASSCLGKQVAPQILGIDDDGTIPGAIASSAYDGEGVPRRLTEVVSHGTVQTFLHNSYSAGIAGVETTGHAVRRGYRGYVGSGPTNIRVKPGDSSLDEMVAETKRGILVTYAAFFPNIVSGEFSSTIDEGFLIERGEKKHPVKNLMAGGHILELYKHIELISKEGRTIGKGHFFPAVKISRIKLAGK
ncbi:MAG: TldD/PmbA family protein [Candidatus Bathyarchaeia archaeon]